MRKIVLLYGLGLALLIWIMKLLDYRFMVRDLTMEMYLGMVGILCTGLGIWMGLRLTKKPPSIAPVLPQIPEEPSTPPPEATLSKLGISPREYEVLQGLAKGMSNQEIADHLFISLNTVKTHLGKLYSKLEVRRRTQAVEMARRLGLLSPIPQKHDSGSSDPNHPKE